jgi:DUF2075 family protein
MPAYYRATISEALRHSESEIVGQLAIKNGNARFPLVAEQIDAWRWQYPVLRAALDPFKDYLPESYLLLEYPIPVIGQRIDTVLLLGSLIVVIEFKTGEESSGGVRQVEDYAANLANFHEGSVGLTIVPIVVRPEVVYPIKPVKTGAGFIQPGVVDASGLTILLKELVQDYRDLVGQPLNGVNWDDSRFKPIPPIIDAAVRLYEGKDVFAIDHACAPQQSLTAASDALVSIVHNAQGATKKTICFVTGVPGAGKTLVGLNVAHSPTLKSNAIFLSGNGPLVDVIKEALLRDAKRTRGLTRAAALPEINAFIHNVHRFADAYDDGIKVPAQNSIIFDEAQRAWDRQENLKRNKRDKSEPEMLLEIMSRLERATIVALVGGGQEINSGEAGLAEWGRALQKFPDWTVFASPQVLRGDTSTAGFSLFETVQTPKNEVREAPALHLDTSVRSIRGQFIAEWVNEVLYGNLNRAAQLATQSSFPILLTRDLSQARQWLKSRRRGSETAGLVGSASAVRLRADGLEYSFAFHKDFDWKNWFLDDESDFRSSNKLEVFATQFEIQGLELDWIGMCWSEDLSFVNNQWKSQAFRSNTWKPLKKELKHFFRVNGYRVLLTRARQGMIIYVPAPQAEDTTRGHALLDSSYRALVTAGATPLQSI